MMVNYEISSYVLAAVLAGVLLGFSMVKQSSTVIVQSPPPPPPPPLQSPGISVSSVLMALVLLGMLYLFFINSNKEIPEQSPVVNKVEPVIAPRKCAIQPVVDIEVPLDSSPLPKSSRVKDNVILLCYPDDITTVAALAKVYSQSDIRYRHCKTGGFVVFVRVEGEKALKERFADFKKVSKELVDKYDLSLEIIDLDDLNCFLEEFELRTIE